jgi:hypothetical protein
MFSCHGPEFRFFILSTVALYSLVTVFEGSFQSSSSFWFVLRIWNRVHVRDIRKKLSFPDTSVILYEFHDWLCIFNVSVCLKSFHNPDEFFGLFADIPESVRQFIEMEASNQSNCCVTLSPFSDSLKGRHIKAWNSDRLCWSFLAEWRMLERNVDHKNLHCYSPTSVLILILTFSRRLNRPLNIIIVTNFH